MLWQSRSAVIAQPLEFVLYTCAGVGHWFVTSCFRCSLQLPMGAWCKIVISYSISNVLLNVNCIPVSCLNVQSLYLFIYELSIKNISLLTLHICTLYTNTHTRAHVHTCIVNIFLAFRYDYLSPSDMNNFRVFFTGLKEIIKIKLVIHIPQEVRNSYNGLGKY